MNKASDIVSKLSKIFLNNFYFILFYLAINLCFVTILREVPLLINLSKVALLWGICLGFYHLYKSFSRKPNKAEILIYVFLAFTLFLNLIVYRNIENLKIWIVDLVLLTGIFYIDPNKTKNQLDKEINLISNIYIIFTFIFSFLSALVYISGLDFSIGNTTYGLNQGLYIYKNTLSISAAISLVLSLYCYNKTNKNSYKYFLFFNIALQLFNVIYSGGRSAFLLLLAIPFVFIFLYVKNNIYRCSIIIIPALLCIYLFGKFHDKLYNFLSARNELWYSAYLLFKDNLFTGVGNSALVNKVYSMRPDVVLPGIEAGGLHNIYIQIITANGVLSLIIFISIVSIIIYTLTKNIDKLDGKNKVQNSILLILIFGILFVNLFESNLIYISSFISVIFWGYLGLFTSMISHEDI